MTTRKYAHNEYNQFTHHFFPTKKRRKKIQLSLEIKYSYYVFFFVVVA